MITMDCDNHLAFIKKIKQYKQKTDEWHTQRKTRLTSSDAATALGINPYKKPVELLLEKCGTGKSFDGNESTIHGNKYEDEAVDKYSTLMGKQNHDFGLISFGDLDPIRDTKENSKKYINKDYHFLAGSPDGIAIDINGLEKLVMLEIKCPMRRKIKHGQIPAYYYPQVQLNMFILDLEIADFVEYIPPSIGNTEMNIVRVHRDDEWFSTNFPILQAFWKSVELWRTRDIRTHPEYSKYVKEDIIERPIKTSREFLFIETGEKRPGSETYSDSGSDSDSKTNDVCLFVD